MKSILRDFAKAALLAGGLLTAHTASAQQLIIVAPPNPVDILKQNPACLPFGHLDRDGLKFNKAEYHKFDALLKQYAEALESYSRWEDTKKQLGNMQFASNGVCFFNHGAGKDLAITNGQSGTFDLNIINTTPWGAELQTPEDVEKNLDLMVHFTMYNIYSDTLALQVVIPQMDTDFAAFVSTLVKANAHAEAILSTMERGLKEGRLDDLANILYDNSQIIPDEISELYLSATENGTITDEARKSFKTAAFKAFAANPQIRQGTFQTIIKQMSTLAQRGVDISKLFDKIPPAEVLEQVLTLRFGEEITKLEIDGKSLQDAYAQIWSDPATDPATPIKEHIETLKEKIGEIHAKREAQQQQAPTAPATPPVVAPQ